ncbi:MAG: UDP-glucose 4-epimerase GalE [Aquificaceae bacterium]|jgi:UDP-glucose 4-epimerase|uniref:UDP-glucose 4-epimerase GalE n=1 Tax=Hydrogenobacter sp. Uz 6-8 TaxID=3384828 RepID=UPI0030B006B6
MRILVTGGAGYIGSHMVKLLGERGYEVLTVDNLSEGNPWAVLYGDLRVVDLLNYKALEEVLLDFRPEAVIHFAAKVKVPESVRKPLHYYENNLMGTVNLLQAMRRAGTEYLVFSSTAAVYGIPERIPVREEDPTVPINPYGWSKLFAEQAIRDFSHATGLKYVILRYFNVAGADPEGKIGQVSKEPTHLILRAVKVATGQIPYLEVFGTDYPTTDGTCIRDFVHVMDLCEAHLDALSYLQEGGKPDIFNVGYGRGYSVLEVINRVREVSGVDFEVRYAPRREGDPPALVADSTKIRERLGWKPKYEDLPYIIKTALDWEKSYIYSE